MTVDDDRRGPLAAAQPPLRFRLTHLALAFTWVAVALALKQGVVVAVVLPLALIAVTRRDRRHATALAAVAMVLWIGNDMAALVVMAVSGSSNPSADAFLTIGFRPLGAWMVVGALLLVCITFPDRVEPWTTLVVIVLGTFLGVANCAGLLGIMVAS